MNVPLTITETDKGRKKDMTLYECPLNDHRDGYR